MVRNDDSFFALEAGLGQPVPQVLLVKAILVLANIIVIGWPETRRVRRQHFVNKDYFTIAV